jgi:glucose-1-phosphate cytidylyltransferase
MNLSMSIYDHAMQIKPSEAVVGLVSNKRMPPLVILAGGRGTRLFGSRAPMPKPLVRIGDKPILWHIITHYASFGITDIIIAAGYKHKMIEDWVSSEDFGGLYVEVVDTGENTMTGGRLRRLESVVQDDFFHLTYGDGISNVDISKLEATFALHTDCEAIVTVVHPPARFGHVELCDQQGHFGKIACFDEKPTQVGWINGGFMMFTREIFKHLHDDGDYLERQPIQELVHEGKVMSYIHEGFWQCIDTPRDVEYMNKLFHELSYKEEGEIT